MQILIKECAKHTESRKQLIKNLDLISSVIVKVVDTSDTWKIKKVKKTMNCLSIFTKAAHIIVHSPEASEAVSSIGNNLIYVLIYDFFMSNFILQDPLLFN